MMIMRNRSGVRQLRLLRTLVWVAVLVLLFGAVVLWRQEVSSVFLRFTAPALALRSRVGTADASLAQALAAATAAKADRDVLYAENMDLKNRLHRNAGRAVTLAGVLLRPPAVPYDTLVVDAGAREGVVVGSTVAAGGTAVIGSVVEVYDTTSRIRLLSAPGNTYEGTLLLADKTIPLTIEGQGGGSMRAQIPAGSGAVVGNSVVLPGVFGGYVGTVSYVETKSGESFESIYVHLATNPLELRYVEIWHENSAQ